MTSRNECKLCFYYVTPLRGSARCGCYKGLKGVHKEDRKARSLGIVIAHSILVVNYIDMHIFDATVVDSELSSREPLFLHGPGLGLRSTL